MTDLNDEAIELFTYLEQRKLTPKEACAVMGIALQSLIADAGEAQLFIRTLQQGWDEA